MLRKGHGDEEGRGRQAKAAGRWCVQGPGSMPCSQVHLGAKMMGQMGGRGCWNRRKWSALFG